jgi:hypothetical protein
MAGLVPAMTEKNATHFKVAALSVVRTERRGVWGRSSYARIIVACKSSNAILQRHACLVFELKATAAA